MLSNEWRESKVEGGVGYLREITRPSNGMLNHWVCSAACFGSSPTPQPAAITNATHSGYCRFILVMLGYPFILPVHMAMP